MEVLGEGGDGAGFGDVVGVAGGAGAGVGGVGGAAIIPSVAFVTVSGEGPVAAGAVEWKGVAHRTFAQGDLLHDSIHILPG